MGLTLVLSVGGDRGHRLRAEGHAWACVPAPRPRSEGLDDIDHGEAGYHPEEISGHSSQEEAGAMSATVPALAK